MVATSWRVTYASVSRVSSVADEMDLSRLTDDVNANQTTRGTHSRSHGNRCRSEYITTNQINRPASGIYTVGKLSCRSSEDLKALADIFKMQVQIFSEELVALLQERHDLRQQIEIRKVGVEQLLRFQGVTNDNRPNTNDQPVPDAADNRSQGANFK